ncbi:CLUMA_CG002758, isoform A [Clunio marinus]|uniref:CLUMA_CG002758, isoform A n=1 Tax=Clunio marinus TaxID=568069 RepID=A0A1J1HN38_9DIPT|nr:CLUMA_CG002758, isoform A [Clunio marinus]
MLQDTKKVSRDDFSEAETTSACFGLCSHGLEDSLRCSTHYEDYIPHNSFLQVLELRLISHWIMVQKK